MIDAARAISPGAGGIVVIPAFMPSGPTKPYATQGTILGLELTSERGQVFRAVLEGLVFSIERSNFSFRGSFGYNPQRVRVVGEDLKISYGIKLGLMY